MEQEKDRQQRLGRATAVNAAMAVGSMAISVITGNPAFAAESVHDLGDTAAHGSRYMCEHRGVDQNSRAFQWFRWASFGALSVMSGYMAVKFGLAVPEAVQSIEQDPNNTIEILGATAVAAGNTYAHKTIDGIEEHSNASQDSHHHSRVDMVASLGLVTSILIEACGVNGASEVGGSVFAGYTAYKLFPTKNRMRLL